MANLKHSGENDNLFQISWVTFEERIFDYNSLQILSLYNMIKLTLFSDENFTLIFESERGKCTGVVTK